MKAYFSILLFISFPVLSQETVDALLKEYNTQSVPYISVNKLYNHLKDYIVLDTRKKEEYDVSHIPTAIWSGENPNTSFESLYPEKNKPIVVYCSIGIRSEDFGERLQEQGYTNVHNLYGSIFAWKDNGYPVLNAQNKPTDSVHVFSKEWKKYIRTGIKVYNN